MIKKNYKTVGFIYKNNQNIDKVYKGTNLVFEQGYTREQTGVPPITTTYQAIGKNLKDYKVYGNTVQNGTPTPQNPIQPSETGERTGNLFDYKTVYEPYIDSNGNISTTANVLASWNYFAEADVGKTITVSLYVGSISASYIRVQGQIDGSYITGNAINAGSKGYTEITVTPTSTSDRWRIIYGTGTPDVVLNQVMVAVSATRKDYEPYGYKIPVIVGSDNLATNLGFGWYSGANQKFTISYDFKRCTAKIKPNTTYTISKKNASNRFVVITSELEIAPNASYKRVVLAEQNTNRTQYTFTTQEDENYLFFGYYRGTDETEIELAEEEMMIVEGSTTPSKYIPYYNETTNIYLDEPLRKIGDYLDYIDFKNSKVVRNIAKKVLNGTEDWGMPGTIIPGYSSYRIVNFIPNIPLQTPIEELLCTHFEAFPKSQYQKEPIQNKITSYGNTNQIIILVSNNIADSNNQTTTANWINWLSNNNITLYYSKQPTEETIALPNIPTIKGTTIIEIDTNINASNMYIKYKSK